MSAARSSSALSSTKPAASGARTPATPTAPTSWPSVSSMPASGPLTAWAPIIGVTATTRSRRRRDRSAQAVDGEDRVERDERIGGREHDRLRALDGLEHPRRGARPRGAVEAHGAHGVGRAPPDEPLLEGQLAAGRDDARAQAVVARGQQAGGEAVAPREVGGDGRQRLARAQALAAHEVQADVAIAEDEPVDAAELGHDRHRLARVAGDAPALLGMDASGQRVEQRVEVGRDRQAPVLEVVTDVADDRDVLRGDGGEQAAREARTADAACEQGHPGQAMNPRSPGVSTSRSIPTRCRRVPPWRAALPGP